MNHSEALEQMAAERYLLDELGPDARDEFEEHMFDCPDCALDVRAGVVFIDEAKKQLPEMAAAREAKPERAVVPGKAVSGKAERDWLAWLRPVYMAPAFAALLIVVGYQNLVEVPALRLAANEPHLAPLTPLRGATRGDEHQKLTATKKLGLSIPVDVPPADGTGYVSYAAELANPEGKVEQSTMAVTSQADQPAQLALTIPGKMLENGTYTMKVLGVDAQGAETVIETDVFDVEMK